jgi:hypothetical protein
MYILNMDTSSFIAYVVIDDTERFKSFSYEELMQRDKAS